MKENTAVVDRIISLFPYAEAHKEIEDLLMENSNLPGPRSNLTLADKFVDCFGTSAISDELLSLMVKWVSIPADDGPTNDPREYLPFCGILSLGAHYCYANDVTKALIMNQIKIAMNDKRWRVREGAAMSLQRIAEIDFSPIKVYFKIWYKESNDLEKRAFVAALAHPPILKNEEVARFSLRISEDILNDLLISSKERRRTEGFNVLFKGLQYALSVFVAYLPEEGFAFLRKYAGLNHPDLNRIIKSNLGKSRLQKKYPQKVNEVIEVIIQK